MKFKRVYKCRRCAGVFTPNSIAMDDQEYTPFGMGALHEHICGENQHGFAEVVGFDVVPESGTSGKEAT